MATATATAEIAHVVAAATTAAAAHSVTRGLLVMAFRFKNVASNTTATTEAVMVTAIMAPNAAAAAIVYRGGEEVTRVRLDLKADELNVVRL